ncbi:MAG TPA: hypothetical protein VE912_19205 [Bacteroidales bacterium]|nr:hypothetical protein [Bacteroidales bacterium]
MKIKTNKRFDDVAPGFETEMEYRFDQVMNIVASLGGVSATAKSIDTEVFEFNSNTHNGIIRNIAPDEWVTEIIVV